MFKHLFGPIISEEAGRPKHPWKLFHFEFEEDQEEVHSFFTENKGEFWNCRCVTFSVVIY